MEKVMIGRTRLSPAPAVIVGATVDKKPNYVTIAGFGGMSLLPPLVYITMAKTHYTNKGIRDSGFFSVNIPSASMVKQTDYVGLVSGRDTDKSQVFTAFYGTFAKAPMVKECPVNMLCEVHKTVDLPNNDVFIGKVLEVYVDEDCMAGSNPDVKKIKPLVLMGGLYWELGNCVGVANKEGKALIKD